MPLFQASVPVVAVLEAPDPQAAIRQLADRIRQAGLSASTAGGQASGYATEVTGSDGQQGAGDRWGRNQQPAGGRDRWGRSG